MHLKVFPVSTGGAKAELSITDEKPKLFFYKILSFFLLIGIVNGV